VRHTHTHTHTEREREREREKEREREREKEGQTKDQGEHFLHKSNRRTRCLDRDLTRSHSPSEEKIVANY
jgi:hypothetical protein